MGRLRSLDSGVFVELRGRHRVGRAADVDLRIDDPRVSGEHALVRWEVGSWVAQDLASTNGVYIDGRRITEPTPLTAGARIGFGAPEPAWELEDDAAPVAFAERGEERRYAEDGKIVLVPGRAVVVQGSDGWRLHDANGARRVADGDTGEGWRLVLPEILPRTQRTTPRVELARCRVRFDVSLDQEHVAVTLVTELGEQDVGEVVWGYLAWRLAERRAEDAGDVSERGWVEKGTLLRELRVDRDTLNMWIHRLRRRFSEAGVIDAERVIETRDRGRIVRWGLEPEDAR